jgi:hypothetical protein
MIIGACDNTPRNSSSCPASALQLGTKEAFPAPNTKLICLQLARQPTRLPRQADTPRPGLAQLITMTFEELNLAPAILKAVRTGL